jgi:hypothetical protein
MLTPEDIKNLTDYQIEAFKDVFVVKDDFNELREQFDILQTSIDAYAKRADTYFQEMVSLAHKVDRHEKWFHMIAEKLDIKLEY